MSLPIKISQLVTMSLASLSDADFLPIVDIGSMATQRVTVGTLGQNFRSGSYTGSAQFLNSVSFQGTASYARGALSSSYALTASIAELANNVGGLYTRIYVDSNHGFKVGHVIRKLKASESGLSAQKGYITCSIIQDLSGSEAIGLVVDSGSADGNQYIRVCYQGIADFSDDGNFTASYLSSGLITGSVYFLGTTGSLILTEPSDIGSISKPMLIALTTSSGLIINSRGIKIGTNATTSSLSASNYATTPFTTSLNRIPSYLRTTLICTSAGGDPGAGFSNLDELDSTSIFSTSSINAPYSSPFLTIKTSATAYTASFKTLASGWTTGSVYSASVIRHLDLSKWTFKIYS